MREYITFECDECKRRNYQSEKETRGPGRLKIKKFCRWCRKHTPHSERRK